MTLVLNIVCGFLMFVGAWFILVASIGVVRMPDLYLRMAATTKAATLGAACMMLGLAFYFLGLGFATRAIAAVVFLFMTAPIAAHMLGRAAYSTGVPLWEGTKVDELAGHYDEKTHILSSDRPATSQPTKSQRIRQSR
jgi:multicomponent Na+:H+ antiporter subunit G